MEIEGRESGLHKDVYQYESLKPESVTAETVVIAHTVMKPSKRANYFARSSNALYFGAAEKVYWYAA